MGRVLVTGAAGFIGSHLVERLLCEGHEVVGVDSFTGYYSRGRKERNLSAVVDEPGFELLEGDLLSLEPDELLLGMDAVFHLAGEPGVRRSWGSNFGRYMERNVLTTQRLLEAASGSVARFVYVSSSSVYGGDAGGPVAEDHPRRPASPYGMSKLAAEELVELYRRERGVPATVLRYFTVYGPRQRPEMALARFLFAAKKGRPVDVFGDGEQVRDMTYVLDAVEATVASLEGGTRRVQRGRRHAGDGERNARRRAAGDRRGGRGPVRPGGGRRRALDVGRLAAGGKGVGLRPPDKPRRRRCGPGEVGAAGEPGSRNRLTKPC